MIDYAAAYTRWRGPLMAFIGQRTHVVEPEDLIQDLFVELLECGAQPDYALIFWILRRRIIDAQRRADRRPTRSLDDVEPAIDGPDVERVAAAELLATFPPRVQIIVRLAAAGYTQDKIARALGTTRGAINATMIRARRALGIGGWQDRPRCAECDRPVHAKSLCERHYDLARYYQRQRAQQIGGAP